MTKDQSADQGAREEGKARRAYGWYKGYSRFNWLRRAWWFFWDFRTRADIIAAVVALGTIGGAGTMVVTDAADYARRTARQPAQVEVIRWSDNSSVYSIIGKDYAGREAWFDILVLDKEYTWVRASWRELEHNGRKLTSSDVARDVFNDQIRDGLGKSKEFIAVGIASSEGDPDEERQRARRRARVSARWLAKAMDDTVTDTGPMETSLPIWLLSLGQYVDACQTCETSKTSWQRPFLVIGIRNKQQGVMMQEALRDAFRGKTNLPSARNYSAFSLIAPQPNNTAN